jgi:transcriptional regulator with XRE-family HTH domain
MLLSATEIAEESDTRTNTRILTHRTISPPDPTRARLRKKCGVETRTWRSDRLFILTAATRRYLPVGVRRVVKEEHVRARATRAKRALSGRASIDRRVATDVIRDDGESDEQHELRVWAYTRHGLFFHPDDGPVTLARVRAMIARTGAEARAVAGLARTIRRPASLRLVRRALAPKPVAGSARAHRARRRQRRTRRVATKPSASSGSSGDGGDGPALTSAGRLLARLISAEGERPAGFARRIGCSRQRLQGVLRNGRLPRADLRDAIARALDVPLAVFGWSAAS